jgi:hypothetical protein
MWREAMVRYAFKCTGSDPRAQSRCLSARGEVSDYPETHGPACECTFVRLPVSMIEYHVLRAAAERELRARPSGWCTTLGHDVTGVVLDLTKRGLLRLTRWHNVTALPWPTDMGRRVVKL